MANEALLRKAAMKGFMGHSALLDPDTFVSNNMPQQSELGPMVAQNSTNEFGMSDRLKVSIPREPVGEAAATKNIRTKEQADLNERLLKQGIPPEQVLAMEQAK